MAPNTSGFSAVDQPRMIYLCELAMDFAEQVLPEGGTLVIKVFQGEGSDALRKNMQQRFSKCVVSSLQRHAHAQKKCIGLPPNKIICFSLSVKLTG